MEPAELCCKIIAWIDLTLSGLFIGIIGLFTLLLISVPEMLHHIVNEDPVQHKEVEEFLNTSDAAQAGFIILLIGFWSVIFVLALLLLRWTKARYVRGLRIWIYSMAAITLVCVPFDFYVMYKEGFRINAIIIFVLGNGYSILSMWAVYYFCRFITSREGDANHIVEFQALT